MIKELIKEALSELLAGENIGGEKTETPTNHLMAGSLVVVRCRNAGVHYGKLESAGDFIQLSDSHRIWKWSGAFTLSELSQNGITGGRIACAVKHLSIPVGDVGEILNLTTKAHETLSGYIES